MPCVTAASSIAAPDELESALVYESELAPHPAIKDTGNIIVAIIIAMRLFINFLPLFVAFK